MTTRLENWSIRTDNPYAAPEVARVLLVGRVYGHPRGRHADGKMVQTSRVLKAEGRSITTRNTTYELGEADLEYQQWMKDNGVSFDPDNPITLKS